MFDNFKSPNPAIEDLDSSVRNLMNYMEDN